MQPLSNNVRRIWHEDVQRRPAGWQRQAGKLSGASSSSSAAAVQRSAAAAATAAKQESVAASASAAAPGSWQKPAKLSAAGSRSYSANLPISC